jgi:tetratricopeptide (TPR) repeat protein
VRYALGDYQGALDDANTAIQLNPNSGNAYNNRGVARDALGDTKAAIEDWKQAAELYQQQGDQDGYAHTMNLIKLRQGP